jgi:hypothetical protein
MIKSLSPYYLEVPLVAPLSLEVCTSFTLQIFVWDGLKNDPPAEPEYEITKDNPTASSGSEEINIALLVNDYIDFIPSFSDLTELADGLNQRWVKTQILYTTSDEDDFVPNYEQTFLMTQGYGYGLDGKNQQLPTNNILLQGTEFKVSRTGKFVLPILIQETVDASTLVLDSVILDTGSTYDYSFTSSFSFTQLYSQVRATSGDAWSTALLFSGTTSPQSRIVSVGGGVFETRIYAFNVLTGNNIFSNVISVS